MRAPGKVLREFSAIGIVLVLGMATCKPVNTIATSTPTPETSAATSDAAQPITQAATLSTPLVASPAETALSPRATPTLSTASTIPLTEHDPFLLNLKSQNYELTASSSIQGPRELVYSAYLFIDKDFDPLTPSESTQDVCQLAFYRWDGKQNELLSTFHAAKYPATNPYFGGSYPIFCEAIEWHTRQFDSGELTDTVSRALGLHSYWSDINQNGLPEQAIYYFYCRNACGGYPEDTVRFYEIQDSDTVVDITSNLPGVLLYWDFVHSIDPPTFYIYDARLVYEAHLWIQIPWIYQWNGMDFVDVSQEYADEYTSQADKIATQVQDGFGNTFNSRPRNEIDILTILLLYEKAGLREQGLHEFLELTDSVNWPQTQSYYGCWLQIARALEQERYEQGKPFALPISTLYLDLNLSTENPYWQTFDQSKYEFSACKQFKP